MSYDSDKDLLSRHIHREYPWIGSWRASEIREMAIGLCKRLEAAQEAAEQSKAVLLDLLQEKGMAERWEALEAVAKAARRSFSYELNYTKLLDALAHLDGLNKPNPPKPTICVCGHPASVHHTAMEIQRGALACEPCVTKCLGFRFYPGEEREEEWGP